MLNLRRKKNTVNRMTYQNSQASQFILSVKCFSVKVSCEYLQAACNSLCNCEVLLPGEGCPEKLQHMNKHTVTGKAINSTH